MLGGFKVVDNMVCIGYQNDCVIFTFSPGQVTCTQMHEKDFTALTVLTKEQTKVFASLLLESCGVAEK
jgi:hypothetical protein